MTRIFGNGILAGLLLALSVLLAPQLSAAADTAQEQAQRQAVQPGNNAPLWREVRQGENPYQTTQVRGVETRVLVQSQGESWREARPPLALAGGVLIALVVVVLYLYFRWRGQLGTHGQPTGRLIQRFSDLERMAHWTVAISFVALGITGVILAFGKYVLIPVLGYTLFSWLAAIAKNIHNFVGPVFLLSLPVVIVLFVRDNFLQAYDIQWLLKGGGLTGGEYPPAGRFNAAEKAWFWFGALLLGLTLSVSGLVLDFPNFGQGRAIMQVANLTHVIAAMLAIAVSLFHIYMGTIGVAGAYDAMRTGTVDETWAKDHYEIWYHEVKAGKSAQQFVDAAPPPATAQPQH